ncbi:MmyB family transcriptional regulator [Nonomuraea deserti]|uniref:MmyB family transcriptional regulator n=1 Tax=Nonomuraea deserti TaxID=1848322 RepID=UPI001C700CB6
MHDASWTLVLANAPYDALMGETSTRHGIQRNAVWRNLLGPGARTVHTAQEQADHEARLVADLRLTASRYPADRALRRLISELADKSPRFAELWDSDAPAPSVAEDPGGPPAYGLRRVLRQVLEQAVVGSS